MVYLVFRIARPLIMLMVWTAIYLNTSAATIGGFTLPETLAYFFLTMPVMLLIDDLVTDVIQDDVQGGAVASARVKPMSYPLNVLSRAFAVGAVDMVLLAVPLFALTFFAFHLTLTLTTLALLIVEVLVGAVIVNLIGFFIGTSAIRLTNVYGLYTAVWTVAWLLSGMMMPLNFFPPYAQQLLMLSPFPVMCYLPVATLLGTLSVAQMTSGILVALAWAAALAVLAYVWWKRVSRDMGSAGG